MAVDGHLNFDTKVNTKGFNNGTKSLTGGLSKVGSMLGKLSSGSAVATKVFTGGCRSVSGGLDSVKSKLGNVATAVIAAFSVKKLIDFGKTAVQAASETSNAWQGLESIMNGQGRDYGQATKWIQEYVSDGLVPLSNAVTAYKNLAARGYDDTQIQNVLTALKDSAAYGRQASYSLGDAVTSASEGLKNENSILVDNAGVTKNVAKMWDDYAKSIGTTSNNLTQEQKIQAEVNGILTETRFQTGDAAKVANTFSGRISQLTFKFNELKVALGNILTAVLKPIIEYLSVAISKITSLLQSAAKALGIADKASGSASALAGNTSDLSDTSSDAADNYGDMAKSAEKAKKANERSLASFDKITKLSDNKSDDDSTSVIPSLSTAALRIPATVDVETKGAESKISKAFQRIKGLFRSGDWGKIGELLAQKINSLFGRINWKEIQKKVKKGVKKITAFLNGFVRNIKWKKLGRDIGEGFNTVLSALYTFMTDFDWTALGRALGSLLNGMINSVNWSMVGSYLASKWNALINFLYGFVTTFDWSVFGTAISDAVNSWFDTIDWAKVGETISIGLKGVLTSIKSFFENVDTTEVAESLNTFFSNIDWVGIGIAFGGLINSVFSKAIDFTRTFDWSGFGTEIASTVSSWFTSINWEDIGTTITDSIRGLFNTALAFLEGIDWTEIGTKIGTFITSIDWVGIAVDFFKVVKAAFESSFTILWSAMTPIAFKISKWFQDLSPVMKTVISLVGTLAAAFLVYKAVLIVVTVIQSLFALATAIANSQVALLVAAIVLLIGVYAALWCVFHQDEINDFIGKLKLLTKAYGEFKDEAEIEPPPRNYPDYSNMNFISGSTHGGGGGSFDDDDADSYLKTAAEFYSSYDFGKEFDLPKFATGTVVPANYGEFLAILGDNKKEREYVSPESAMKQSFKDAINEMGGVGGNGGVYEFTINLDGRKIHKEIVRINNSEIRKTSNNPLVPAY